MIYNNISRVILQWWWSWVRLVAVFPAQHQENRRTLHSNRENKSTPWGSMYSTILNPIFVHFWMNEVIWKARSQHITILDVLSVIALPALSASAQGSWHGPACWMRGVTWAVTAALPAGDADEPWWMFWWPVGAGGRAACFPSGESNTKDKITHTDWPTGDRTALAAQYHSEEY